MLPKSVYMISDILNNNVRLLEILTFNNCFVCVVVILI